MNLAEERAYEGYEPVVMALRATKWDENQADHKERWSAPRCVFDGAPQRLSSTESVYRQSGAHSQRRARMGSTRAARCAGTYPANSATSAIPMVAQAMVNASFG